MTKVQKHFEDQISNADPLDKETLEEMNNRREEHLKENPDANVTYVTEDKIGQKHLYYMEFRDESQEEFDAYKEQLKEKDIPPPEEKGAICEMKPIWENELPELQEKIDNGDLEYHDSTVGNDIKFPRFRRTDMDFDITQKGATGGG